MFSSRAMQSLPQPLPNPTLCARTDTVQRTVHIASRPVYAHRLWDGSTAAAAQQQQPTAAAQPPQQQQPTAAAAQNRQRLRSAAAVSAFLER